MNNNSIDKFDENKLFRSNSGNKNCLCNHDEFFPNIITDKKNKTITNFKVNKDKKIFNLKLYNNDNVDVIEELNVMNDDKGDLYIEYWGEENNLRYFMGISASTGEEIKFGNEKVKIMVSLRDVSGLRPL